MHSTTEPLNEETLAQYEADRGLAADVLQTAWEMKVGFGSTIQDAGPHPQVGRHWPRGAFRRLSPQREQPALDSLGTVFRNRGDKYTVRAIPLSPQSPEAGYLARELNDYVPLDPLPSATDGVPFFSLSGA